MTDLAVCPRVEQLVRNVVFDVRRIPGVRLGGGKSNLPKASKISHLLLADAPSTAPALPTDGLPGPEGLLGQKLKELPPPSVGSLGP